MTRIFALCAALFLHTACGDGTSSEQEGPRTVSTFAPDLGAQVSVLARYPGPTFLENLVVAPDLSVLLTNYTAKQIDRWHPRAGGNTFARLDEHPVALTPVGFDYVATAHARSFTSGEAVMGSGVILRLDALGAVVDRLAVPQAGFLHGAATLEDGTVLIADSAKGEILRFDPVSRSVTQWFADPDLAPLTAPRFVPGANGLKRSGTSVYVSSSARRTIFRLTIGPGGQAVGPLTPVTSVLPGADDFAILPDDRFLVATHGGRVILADQFGMMTTVTDHALTQGSTAVALWGNGEDQRALILGTGGFSEGRSDDAALVMVRLPD